MTWRLSGWCKSLEVTLERRQVLYWGAAARPGGGRREGTRPLLHGVSSGRVSLKKQESIKGPSGPSQS
jgi:hypothetical protein